MQNNVLQLKTLAITELMERHSAIYLKEMVIWYYKILKLEFKIINGNKNILISIY